MAENETIQTIDWQTAVDSVAPYVVKIDTPRGHGTGFLCLYNTPRTLCGIATAYHVVQHAEDWLEPIRIRHEPSDAPLLLKESDRAILCNDTNDSAVIVFPTGDLKFPEKAIPLVPADKTVRVGVDVGWLGYPAVSPQTLTFFGGIISASNPAGGGYFIDGVAINGVSGGPVFHRVLDEVYILGTISAYIPNVATGDTLPGLSFAQGVTHFHDTIARIQSLEQARALQKEQSSEEQPGEA